MDRVKETTDVLIDINRYKAKKIATEDLIKTYSIRFEIPKIYFKCFRHTTLL